MELTASESTQSGWVEHLLDKEIKEVARNLLLDIGW